MRSFFQITILLVLLSGKAMAFSLLGPYADWMDETKTFRIGGDIGGPMNISEGYRWNIPVVTYGFDRAFLDYFGSNGVAAAESAFQVLNGIPPASQINLTNYLMEPWGVNYMAQALELTDLKSVLLASLLEQMGITAPARNVFCVRDYQYFSSNSVSYFVVQRNYDPATAQPSSYVNETLFTYQILQFSPSPTQGRPFCDAVETAVDPLASGDTSVVGSLGVFSNNRGRFAASLSRDDVGAIRFLLSGSQVRFESLPTDVESVNTNIVLVSSAYRPGIEKVTFARHPFSTLSGGFLPATNQWTDVYYSGNSVGYQTVQRRLSQPDILITARDLLSTAITRTGTTNWVNQAAQNGNPGGPGPGVIQPHITIALNNAAPIWINSGNFFLLPPATLSEGTHDTLLRWGSFNGSTNPPVIYPSGFVQFQPTVVHFRLATGGRTNLFSWSLPGVANMRFHFQSSTNLTSWVSIATITNSGVPFSYFHRAQTNEPSRFFRLRSE